MGDWKNHYIEFWFTGTTNIKVMNIKVMKLHNRFPFNNTYQKTNIWQFKSFGKIIKLYLKVYGWIAWKKIVIVSFFKNYSNTLVLTLRLYQSSYRTAWRWNNRSSSDRLCPRRWRNRRWVRGNLGVDCPSLCLSPHTVCWSSLTMYRTVPKIKKEEVISGYHILGTH